MSASTAATSTSNWRDKDSGAVQRAASIDIFRALVMVVMIFVNDLADVKGLPAWTYHMPARVDAMSYVDMVFPAFLFAMGMSLPLALQSRLARSASMAGLWIYIVLRSVSLMVLGLILANAGRASSAMLLPITGHQWTLLSLLGAALFLAVYPKRIPVRTVFAARMGGLVLVAIMLAIFRRNGPDGATHWLSFSYWEILGIIGWTYLATCVFYVPLRRWSLAPILLLSTAILFHVAAASHMLAFPDELPLYVWPWSNGAFVELTLAGAVTTQLLILRENGSKGRRGLAIAFGIALLVVAWLLVPLGISKIRATPTWSLASAGASVLLFVMLHWVCDEQQQTRWASFMRSAGTNTLLTYLLPDVFFFAIGMWWVPRMWTEGAAGVVRSLIFTAVMLMLSALLTRVGLRLRL